MKNVLNLIPPGYKKSNKSDKIQVFEYYIFMYFNRQILILHKTNVMH